MGFQQLLLGGLAALYDYVAAHTLFCLVPAFFIAGAMAALIPKEKLLKYLGKDSPRRVAYPLAVVSGLLLAVCSCTVLPIFAGIRKRGAGIGPAIAFLYTAPATNIIAVLYTGSLISWNLAFARILFSVLFAVIIGLLLSSLFGEEEPGSGKEFAASADSKGSRRLLYLFGALVGILIVGTRVPAPKVKYALTLCLIALAFFVTRRFFTREEAASWMAETWNFTKMIFPLLLAGVFVSGIIRELIPKELITTHVGTASLTGVLIPVLFGIFVYFPTLVEVPMARTFLDLGMGMGPLLAYLLADPVISLPSILVVRRLMGTRRTAVYVLAILVLCVSAGLLYGRIAG